MVDSSLRAEQAEPKRVEVARNHTLLEHAGVAGNYPIAKVEQLRKSPRNRPI